MTGPHTTPQNDIIQTDVEREIRRMVDELDAASVAHAHEAVQASEAEHLYKVSMAKATLKWASGEKMTVDQRNAHALEECSEMYRDRLVKNALRDAAIEKCRNLRAQLNALQSINANLREMVR
jgi:hypothetical protein